MSERGNYRSISCSLLAGKDFRALPERPRWIFVVLKMNFNFTGIDTWYPDELRARISNESGASEAEVEVAFQHLERAGWMFREDNVVWLVGHIDHDPHMKPSDPKHRKAAQRILGGLPRIPLVARFMKGLPEWFPRSERASMGLGWAFEGPPKQGKGKGDGKGERKKEMEGELPMAPDGAAPSGLALLPKEVCDRTWRKWGETFGPHDYGRFRKELLVAFQPGLPVYTADELENAIQAAYEWWIEQDDREQGFFKFPNFVGQLASKWVPFGRMDLTDHGELTERGAWAGSKAMRAESRRPRITA